MLDENAAVRDKIPVIFQPLMMAHTRKVDLAIIPGLTLLCWTSLNLQNYFRSIRSATRDLDLIIKEVCTGRIFKVSPSAMIQLYTKAMMQSGGTTPSVQRDLIPLVNRLSSWRSPIFFHWSDSGIVRVFFCYSAVLRVVRAPSLPSSMLQ